MYSVSNYASRILASIVLAGYLAGPGIAMAEQAKYIPKAEKVLPPPSPGRKSEEPQDLGVVGEIRELIAKGIKEAPWTPALYQPSDARQGIEYEFPKVGYEFVNLRISRHNTSSEERTPKQFGVYIEGVLTESYEFEPDEKTLLLIYISHKDVIPHKARTTKLYPGCEGDELAGVKIQVQLNEDKGIAYYVHTYGYAPSKFPALDVDHDSLGDGEHDKEDALSELESYLLLARDGIREILAKAKEGKVSVIEAGTRSDSARLSAAAVSGCTALPAAPATSSFSFANGKVSRNVCIGVVP
jgi:hypothetical protein